jgi:hypothetical protein
MGTRTKNINELCCEIRRMESSGNVCSYSDQAHYLSLTTFPETEDK